MLHTSRHTNNTAVEQGGGHLPEAPVRDDYNQLRLLGRGTDIKFAIIVWAIRGLP